MFEQTDQPPDVLPIYPGSISGELRIILQVKDQFLMCFKYIEAFQSLWEQQNRIITKDFILEQVKNGEIEIQYLEGELATEKDILGARERHNEALIAELRARDEYYVAETSNFRVKGCKDALFKSCTHNLLIGMKDSGFITVLEGIAERIDAAQKELRNSLRPLLEYYKDIYYLQLHFTLALTQVSCYCMPLMTDTISLVDRLFFWSERPEFELIRKSGQISDRLRDIYTRLQRILCRLFDSVNFLQDRIEMQRMLEIKFFEKIRQMKQRKDTLLEEIHTTRMKLDLLEEENDRLVGTLAKIDPHFTETEAFMLYAEHKGPEQTTTESKPKKKLSGILTSNSIMDSSKSKKISVEDSNKANINNDMVNMSYNELKKLIDQIQPVKIKPKKSMDCTKRSKVNNPNQLDNWKENLTKMLQSYHNKSKSETNLVQLDDLFNEPKSKTSQISSNKTWRNDNSQVKRKSKSLKYKINIENKKLPESNTNSSGTAKTSGTNQATDCMVLSSDVFPSDN